jgi:hypothetical protein
MKTGDILYLSSLESMRFKPVRECKLIHPLSFDTGKQCALMKIGPPAIGQDFNEGNDIEMVLLANRHEGETLFPIKEFPCFVFICRPLIEGIERHVTVSKDEVEIIGWGSFTVLTVMQKIALSIRILYDDDNR